MSNAVHQDEAQIEDVSVTQESQFSAEAAIHQTQLILSSTKSAVFSTVTDAKWWQNVVSCLKQPERRQEVTHLCPNDRNASFKKQGCHPFYSSTIDNSYEDVVSSLLSTQEENIYFLEICIHFHIALEHNKWR